MREAAEHTEDILETPPPEVKAEGGKPNGKAKEEKGGDELAELRKRMQALERERDELRESERMWAERARGRGRDEEGDEEEEVRKPKKKAPADDDDTPTDGAALMDELVKNPDGVFARQFAKLAKKLGLVSAGDVERMAEGIVSKRLESKVRALTEDNKLMRDYPWLADQKSPQFKRAQEIFTELVGDDPAAKRDPRFLRAAAKAAEAEVGKEEKRSRRHDDDEDEDERLKRVRRQAGDRGRGSSRDEDDDIIGPETETIMEAMNIPAERRGALRQKIAANRKELFD